MPSRFRLLVLGTSTCLLALLLAGAHLGRGASTGEDAYRQMAVFAEVLSRIKSDYVEEPDLKSVTLGAVNGLLESIDPFASYLNSDQYKQYLRDKDTLKGDLGMVLAKRFGYVAVVSTLPGSPAAQAGISSGDLIESIKGIATRDMPLAYAELLLKGQPGTAIALSLLHLPDPEPQKVELTRAVVPVPPVTVQMLPDHIGYIRPEVLLAGKAAEVGSAVKSLEKQGAVGLILDLRQCASGLPEEGVAVANLFIDKGLLASVSGQRWPKQEFRADAAKTVSRLPLVVATNGGTADGAEVAATALLENKRAEVVGGRTFGEAAIRRAVTLEDGGALILSVAKYYSPQGKSIQDNGVIPSVPYVESEPGDDSEEPARIPLAPKPPVKPEEDGLIKKAVEVLTKGPDASSQRTAAGADAPGPGPQPRAMPGDLQPGPLGVSRK